MGRVCTLGLVCECEHKFKQAFDNRMRYAKIPDETVRRLPVYLRALSHWTDLGRERISSKDLAGSVGVNPWQIRKDFSYFGQFGAPGVGYDVAALSGHIKKILRLDNDREVALVGVGNLGKAVLAYSGFDRYGLNIVKAFDSNSKKIGKTVQGVLVEDVSDLSALKDKKIKLAILAVPTGIAQDVADRLIAAGVKGILNFSACHLVVPKTVKVTHIDIAMNLASLPYYLPTR